MTRKRFGIIAGILAGIFFLATQGLPDGAEIFRTQGCPNCHSFKGKGGQMAPDLTSVTKRRSDRWIREQLKNPKSHNPNSIMPSFDHLSWAEVRALIKFLNS